MFLRFGAWRGKDLHVKIVVRHGRSCHGNACGAVAYFCCATDLGAAKRVRFENKKTTVLDLDFVFKKG